MACACVEEAGRIDGGLRGKLHTQCSVLSYLCLVLLTGVAGREGMSFEEHAQVCKGGCKKYISVAGRSVMGGLGGGGA